MSVRQAVLQKLQATGVPGMEIERFTDLNHEGFVRHFPVSLVVGHAGAGSCFFSQIFFLFWGGAPRFLLLSDRETNHMWAPNVSTAQVKLRCTSSSRRLGRKCARNTSCHLTGQDPVFSCSWHVLWFVSFLVLFIFTGGLQKTQFLLPY